MEKSVKFVNSYFDLLQQGGFYVFFLGLLILVAVITPLLLGRERLVLPFVISAILIVAIAAFLLEKNGPLLDFSSYTLKGRAVDQSNQSPAVTPVNGADTKTKRRPRRQSR